MRIAQAKLKLDLFDKRYRLYELLRVFLSDGMEPDDEKRLVELRSNFSQCVPQAYFLFGKEIGAYFNDVCEAAEKHRLRTFELRNLKDPAARQRISEPHRELSEWLQEQRSGLVERFGPYLDFENWR